MTCSVEGCSQEVLSRNYCTEHYTQWHNHGDPTKRVYRRRGQTLRDLQDLVSTAGDECQFTPSGATVTFQGRKRLKHHVAMILAGLGDRPPGLEACHSCGNGDRPGQCVNWRHLRWDTSKANSEDIRRHGRVNRGERNGARKLTEVQVLQILDDGRPQHQIAAEHGVDRRTIGLIKRGVLWGYLHEQKVQL